MPSLISAWNTYIESCSPSQLQYCYLTLGSIPSWIGFLWKAPDPYLNETNHWGQNKKVVQGWIHIWWKQPFRQNKKVVDGGVCHNGGGLGLFSTANKLLRLLSRSTRCLNGLEAPKNSSQMSVVVPKDAYRIMNTFVNTFQVINCAIPCPTLWLVVPIWYTWQDDSQWTRK